MFWWASKDFIFIVEMDFERILNTHYFSFKLASSPSASVTYDITAGTHLEEILSEGARCKYSTLVWIIVYRVRLFFDQNFLSNYELFYGLHVYKNQVHRASNNEIICIKGNFAPQKLLCLHCYVDQIGVWRVFWLEGLRDTDTFFGRQCTQISSWPLLFRASYWTKSLG